MRAALATDRGPIMADEKKTSEDVTEEEQHEPEREPEPDEDNQDEDQCDEAIADLLNRIDQLAASNEQLRAEVSELREQLSKHDSEYEHTRRVEERPADGSESTPEERHFYFRRIGKH